MEQKVLHMTHAPRGQVSWFLVSFLSFWSVFGQSWAREPAQRPRLEKIYINQRKLAPEVHYLIVLRVGPGFRRFVGSKQPSSSSKPINALTIPSPKQNTSTCSATMMPLLIVSFRSLVHLRTQGIRRGDSDTDQKTITSLLNPIKTFLKPF
jgi:hypothetical protein